MAQTVFNRVEKKFLLSEEKYYKIWDDLMNYMEVDEYGKHTICNLYYDTPQDYLIRNSIEKPIYKEKLRVRSYGIPTLNDTVFLEIKKKYKGIVNKRRILLPLDVTYGYLHYNVRPPEKSQILNELDFFTSRYELVPKLFLAYERIALFGKEDNEFRVTFDMNIRSRSEYPFLEMGDHGELLLENNMYLMEVKITNSTPLWFSKLLSKYSLVNSSFSKYGNVYKKQQTEKTKKIQIAS